MARQIAERELDFISPAYPNSPISDSDYGDLSAIIGDEMIFFDDGDSFYPTEETREERVMFLCFAATAPK